MTSFEERCEREDEEDRLAMNERLQDIREKVRYLLVIAAAGSVAKVIGQ